MTDTSLEPVAWVYEFYADMGHKGLAFEEQPSAYNTPLYTMPPPRQPLTDEVISALWSWSQSAQAEAVANTQQHAFARAIEAAHGIKGEA